MKRGYLLIFGLFFWCTTAFAGDPCPNAQNEAKPADPKEKCRTDLTNTLPPVFVFPEDKAQPKAEPEQPRQDDAVKKPSSAQRPLPETCTYSAYAWDTKKGKSTDHFTVSKPYSEVTEDERDPNVPECTICREDQVEIDPHAFGVNHGTIRICHVYAEQVKSALTEIAKSGEFDIEKLEGYRPGKTRGKVDKNGLRTQWSQHSYGTAIDINANHNAIYSQCTEKIVGSSQDVKNCKRGIGGAYQPEKFPRVSIVKDGVVYRIMTKFWKWGGEIEGTTKDIMHFSVTGY
jgi:hypothetical protein